MVGVHVELPGHGTVVRRREQRRHGAAATTTRLLPGRMPGQRCVVATALRRDDTADGRRLSGRREPCVGPGTSGCRPGGGDDGAGGGHRGMGGRHGDVVAVLQRLPNGTVRSMAVRRAGRVATRPMARRRHGRRRRRIAPSAQVPRGIRRRGAVTGRRVAAVGDVVVTRSSARVELRAGVSRAAVAAHRAVVTVGDATQDAAGRGRGRGAVRGVVIGVHVGTTPADE